MPREAERRADRRPRRRTGSWVDPRSRPIDSRRPTAGGARRRRAAPRRSAGRQDDLGRFRRSRGERSRDVATHQDRVHRGEPHSRQGLGLVRGWHGSSRFFSRRCRNAATSAWVKADREGTGARFDSTSYGLAAVLGEGRVTLSRSPLVHGAELEEPLLTPACCSIHGPASGEPSRSRRTDRLRQSLPLLRGRSTPPCC